MLRLYLFLSYTEDHPWNLTRLAKKLSYITFK
nr:MAG TPA: hypothetical protein [Caudoviricetes sp.]